MATKETENTNVTGLGYLPEELGQQNIIPQKTVRKDSEYDLVAALLEAADFQTADSNITEVEIKRAGKYLFTVHIHPLSDSDARLARKKATTYMPNPNNKKLPPIEKEFNNSKFGSWMIYLATTEEDQKLIWGNPQLMAKKGLMEPWESVNALLTIGEKRDLLNEVTKISGLDDDGDDEVMDEEEFQ